MASAVGSASVESLIPGYYPIMPLGKATSFVDTHGNVPIHSTEAMEESLGAMIKAGFAPQRDAFTGTEFLDAQSILRNSAYVPGTLGSPGTIFIEPSFTARQGEAKFTVHVVNQLGNSNTTNIQKTDRGWINSAPGRFYPDFQALTEHLLSTIGGVSHVVGDCMGIHFFSGEQRNKVIKQLESSAPGTYICFAHEPTEEFKECKDSDPTKRNVVMWKSQTGINLAFFHYDSVMKEWKNGGPVRHAREEMDSTGGSASPERRPEILSDSTLGGLIGKKIRGAGMEPTPLLLDK
jgi:hypothetical protein